MIKIKAEPFCAPKRANPNDAGLDLRSNEENFILRPYGDTRKVRTGIKVAIPPGFCGLIVPRSGLGIKGLNLINNVGVIDSDYRGEILVYIVNRSENQITIKRYDRFAQLIIVPVLQADYELVEDLDETTRGESGFGASGT